MLDGETLSTGASFSSLLAPECLRGGTGLIVWVIANEMGRSLSMMFSCMDRDYKNTNLDNKRFGQTNLVCLCCKRVWIFCNILTCIRKNFESKVNCSMPQNSVQKVDCQKKHGIPLLYYYFHNCFATKNKYRNTKSKNHLLLLLLLLLLLF